MSAPAVAAEAQMERSTAGTALYGLLAANPAAAEALSRMPGVEPVWAASVAAAPVSPTEAAVQGLLREHSATAAAVAGML